MRNGLAQGKRHLVHVQLALEHDRHDVGGAAWGCRAGVHDLGQALTVVVVQLLNALVQAGEWLAVGRQSERVCVQCLELVDGVQKLFQRVRLGLVFVHADVGGNARQHHVATNQGTGRHAVQRNMLGRMAIAADAGP